MKLSEPGPLHHTTRIALAVLLVLSHPLWAATIIVDETTCTLVDAITAAETDSATGGCAAGSGADTIELTTDVTLTEVNNTHWGPTALPQVTTAVTIQGAGSVIERGVDAPDFRFLQVTGGTLELNDLTLRNGGGEVSGGALHNFGYTTLSNSTFSGNSGGQGGAIFNTHVLYVENSTLCHLQRPRALRGEQHFLGKLGDTRRRHLPSVCRQSGIWPDQCDEQHFLGKLGERTGWRDTKLRRGHRHAYELHVVGQLGKLWRRHRQLLQQLPDDNYEYDHRQQFHRLELLRPHLDPLPPQLRRR